MKPYQGILAFLSYIVLLLVVADHISMEYCEVIAGGIALFAFGWLLHKKQLLHLSSRDLKGAQLLSCLGIGLGLSLISKMAILFGFLTREPVLAQDSPDALLAAATVATRTVLIPIVEELLFRAILFGSFAMSFSYKIAIVLSAALFALTHDTVSWPTAFLIGVLLAWIYWRTDNLAVTMVIHCTVNFFSLLSIPLYALLTTHRTLGILAGLAMVLLGIPITCLSIKRFLQKHDALPV